MSAATRTSTARFMSKGLAAAAAAIASVLTATAHADLEFKKRVLDNCAEAIAEIETLDQQRRLELIPDLKLLLNLKSSGVESLRPESSGSQKIGAVEAPFSEPGGGDIWKSFQPNRDVRAKRCAVQIIALLSPHSIETLPDLIRLSADHNLPGDFRNIIDQTINSLAVSAAQDRKIEVSGSVMGELLALLKSPHSTKAENAMLEMRERSGEFLLNEIIKPDAELRDRITEALLKIDGTGEIIGAGVLQLLKSADDGLRRRAILLLGRLEQVFPLSVPALIEHLQDISPEVEEASADALADIYAQGTKLPKIVVSEKHLSDLLNAFTSADSRRREQLSPALRTLGPLLPSFFSRMSRAMKSDDADLRAAVVELLGKIEGHATEAGRTVLPALSDQSLNVRIEAVRALGRLKNHQGVVQAFSKVLRTNSKETDTDAKQRVALEVSLAVAKMGLGESASSLAPSLVEALRYPNVLQGATSSELPGLHPAASALISIGRPSIPLLLKHLTSKDLAFKKRAVDILANVTPPQSRAISALAQMLKDPELRPAASEALISFGKPSVPEVKKIYRSPNATAKTAAAKILLALGEENKEMYSLVLENSRKEDCHSKARLPILIPSLGKQAESSFSRELIACIEGTPPAADYLVSALAAVSPLAPEAQQDLIRLIQKNETSKRVKVALLEHALDFGMSGSQLVSLLINLLKEDDKSVQFRVLSIFQSIGASAKEATEELNRFLRANESDQLLANEAVLALMAIDAQSFEFSEYFAKQLASDSYQWAQNSISKVPVEDRLVILQRGLKELPLDKKHRVVDVIGEMGAAAIGLAPDILTYTSSADRRLSYSATAALLKIDPSPALETALRRELLGEFRNDLLSEEFGPALKPLLDKIINTSSSYVEKKIAKLLLTRVAVTNKKPWDETPAGRVPAAAAARPAQSN
ncbi:MAG: HEAT repeat domain-containing protein [Deltaproteobacteria bacterium]|nr:HEAT repeat domain-containing protein [Deltaproteobacteria bacterium]